MDPSYHFKLYEVALVPGPVKQLQQQQKQRLKQLSRQGYLTQSQSEEYVSLLSKKELLEFIQRQHRQMLDAACRGTTTLTFSWEDWLARAHRRSRGYHVV